MNKKFSVIGAIIAGAFLAGIAQSALAEQAPAAAPAATAAVSPEVAAGEKIYKRERCETCHGGNLLGSAAFPNLLTSPKTADKEQFSKIILEGKGAMPSFSANKTVSAPGAIDSLYAYINFKKAK